MAEAGQGRGLSTFVRLAAVVPHLPAIGIIAALGLFAIAARCYPGGTTASHSTVGYSWAHNFVSSLFAVRRQRRRSTLNGAGCSVSGGASCIGCLLVSAVMYYGHLFYEFLPVMQKVTLLACISWLLCAYYTLVSQLHEEAGPSTILAPRG